jgi:hypothetical protein
MNKQRRPAHPQQLTDQRLVSINVSPPVISVQFEGLPVLASPLDDGDGSPATPGRA